MSHWWQLEPEQAAARLGVDPAAGLSDAEAVRRLRAQGENTLRKAATLSPLAVLLDQFKDFMVLVLLGAAAVSWLLGERADALTILAIVFLNAALGFYQEYRAERSLQALRALTAPQARVRRQGHSTVIPAAQVVPGDILLLEAGDRVAADGRVIAATALAAAEAALTGESLPVSKTSGRLSRAGLPLGDRTNMVYAGTTVVAGRGEAVVTATGMRSEIGQIAGMITEAAPGPTPLQQRLEQVGRWLVLVCLFVCGAVGAAGVVRGESLRTMFMAAVSLGVAAIPEGLPAVVTISLALGVQRMARRAAVVRRLPAVETLGCATVVCSDKTGTLTRNEMNVTALAAAEHRYTVSGAGYAPAGAIVGPAGPCPPIGRWPSAPGEAPPLAALLLAGAACNNAELIPADRGDSWRAQGDPTEAALLAAAVKAGLPLAELRRSWPRLGEVPFSSERKRMSVVCRG
ncbi:MAG: cation-translocating P-type ATPase, partial [Bacteroidota bacterium]